MLDVFMGPAREKFRYLTRPLVFKHGYLKRQRVVTKGNKVLHFVTNLPKTVSVLTHNIIIFRGTDQVTENTHVSFFRVIKGHRE